MNSLKDPTIELDEYINDGSKKEKSIAETTKLRSYIRDGTFDFLAKIEEGKHGQRELFRENCVNFASSKLYMTVIFDLDQSPINNNMRDRINELKSRHPDLNFNEIRNCPNAFNTRRIDFNVSKILGKKEKVLFEFSFFMFKDSLEITAEKAFPEIGELLDKICELSKHFRVSDLYQTM
ncbi:MAG: hypothetical protein ACYDAO_02230 [Thermoplasmataceae archaeon]